MTSCPEPVAIFWDYESCYPALTASGYDVAKNIRCMGHKFGTVKLLKAYLKLSEQPRSTLRSELQSSGVSLIDYPGDGPVDKMMLVDMLAYAIDNPPSATIVLISAHCGFAYAISVLRLRQYRVVLIAPSVMGVHISLKSQASVILDCNQDVPRSSMLDRDSSQSSQTGPSRQDDGEASAVLASLRVKADYPESPIITYSPSFPVTTCPTVVGHCHGDLAPQFNMKDSPAKTRKQSETFSQASTVGTTQYHIPERRTAQSGSSSNEKVVSTARGDETVANEHGGQLVTSTDYRRTWRANSQPFEDSVRDWTPGSRADFNSMTPGQALKPKSSSKNGSQIEASSSHEGGVKRLVAQLSCPSVNDPIRVVPTTSRPSSRSTSGHFPLVTSHGSVSPAEPSGFPSHPDGLINLTPSMPTADPMAQRIKPSWAFERDVENDVVNSSLPGPLTVSPSLNSGDYLSRAPPPSAADSSKALRDGVAKIVTNTHATDPILGSVHSSNDSPSTISPSRFRLLVDVLENLRLGGNFLPLRSVVGAQLLLRNKLVYQEAGVTGFTQYITSAERAGIVAVGGTGGKAWVSLHPAGLTPLNHEMSSGKLNNS